jgi:hypothetical protein
MKKILGIILLMLPHIALSIYSSSLIGTRATLEIVGGTLIVGLVLFGCFYGAFYLLDINLDENL